jgi:SAM-dependent methyltransferase
MAKYYGGDYYGKRKSFSDSLINHSRLRLISKMRGAIAGRSFLDVGCGNGGFISLLQKNGGEVAGTEFAPVSHFADSAIAKKICDRDLLRCGFPAEHFDVVTLWHVLEHLNAPQLYLVEIKRVLKDDGILIMQVPNFNSWQAMFFKDKWFHLDVPRHVLHYDVKSLRMVMEDSGFTSIIYISHRSFIYGVFGWLQSILNVLSRRYNLLFDLLNGKILLHQMNGLVRDIFINLLFIVPAFIVSIIFYATETLVGRGGIITIVASKNND